VYLLIRKRAVLRYIRRLLAGYRLPAGKHEGILTDFQTKVNKKKAKKLATERALDKYKFFVFGLTIATTLH